jgi:Secretion system C-terminal sorting domain
MKHFTLFFLLSLCTYFASAQVVYVNRAATGANNGTSWANAYTNLRTAMRVTSTVGRQIWVAAGTYRVDTTSGFVMNPGVQLYGGFAGTETALGQRNATTNVTILSGDISGNDTPGSFTTNRTDNALHVIWLAGADTVSRAVIDGFAIRGGNTAATPPTTPAPTLAATLAAHGGGILAQTPVTVRNCTFSDNAGFNGAAIAVVNGPASGSLVRDCNFERNFTGERSLVYYLSLRSGDIRRCNFQNNITARGCFLATSSRNIVADSCLFTRNRTTGTNLCAGLYTLASTANISNCIFRDNRSDGGAAGMWLNGSNVANLALNVSNCIFERDSSVGVVGNTTIGNGAALHVTSAAAPTISNCIFAQNVAQSNTGNVGGNGGALLVNFASRPTFQNCTFRDNLSILRGGVAYLLSASNSTFRNCTFESNRSNNSAGGVFWNQDAQTQVLVENCTFKTNKASSGGVALCGFESNSTFKGCTFSQNETTGAGGALSCQNERTVVTAENCTFSENTTGGATAGFGGAISGLSRVRIFLTGCTLEKNKSGNVGGAVYLQNDTTRLTATNCIFRENSGRALGGGIFSNVGCDLDLVGCTFSTNTSGTGGALELRSSRADQSDVNISRSTFLENSATTQAGAIDVQNIRNLNITNSLFAGNSGDNGGAISNNASGQDTSHVNLTFCTFYGNIGTTAGIVQYEERDSSDAVTRLQNCIFGEHLGETYAIEQGGRTPVVVSRGGNLCQDNTLRTSLTGTNDLNSTDPQMVSPENGNFRLKPGSPCINKGIPVPGITTDIEGNARGTQPDMGAYEFMTISAFEPVKALRIDMSPNPTANQVVLSLNDDTRGTAVVDFFDVTGKLVLELRSEKAAGEWAITQPVSHWTPGIYQVRLRVGDKLYAGTLVKE